MDDDGSKLPSELDSKPTESPIDAEKAENIGRLAEKSLPSSFSPELVDSVTPSQQAENIGRLAEKSLADIQGQRLNQLADTAISVINPSIKWIYRAYILVAAIRIFDLMFSHIVKEKLGFEVLSEGARCKLDPALIAIFVVTFGILFGPRILGDRT